MLVVHDHGHGHAGHDHGDALRRTAARNVGRLWVALALTVTFVVVEAVTAFVAGSLALLSDAAHMLTDGVAIALALGSIVVAEPGVEARASRTFGLFRLEILASLAERDPHVRGRRLRAGRSGAAAHRRRQRASRRARCSWSRSLGLAVNLVVFFMLRTGAQDSLAVRGAYVDAMADAAGSVGVIVAAVVIATTRVGSDRPHRRRDHRRVDPAARVAARRQRAAGAAAGRARARRPRRDPHRAAWRSPASSTCTTCTCGRSRRRWTSPART